MAENKSASTQVVPGFHIALDDIEGDKIALCDGKTVTKLPLTRAETAEIVKAISAKLVMLKSEHNKVPNNVDAEANFNVYMHSAKRVAFAVYFADKSMDMVSMKPKKK